MTGSNGNICNHPSECFSNACVSNVCVSGTGLSESDTLMWSSVILERIQADIAITYCNDSTSNTYSNWRMPTLTELENAMNNQINGGNSPGGFKYSDITNTYRAPYWSETAISDSQHYSFTFAGASDFSSTETKYNARCVRDVS